MRAVGRRGGTQVPSAADGGHCQSGAPAHARGSGERRQRYSPLPVRCDSQFGTVREGQKERGSTEGADGVRKGDQKRGKNRGGRGKGRGRLVTVRTVLFGGDDSSGRIRYRLVHAMRSRAEARTPPRPGRRHGEDHVGGLQGCSVRRSRSCQSWPPLSLALESRAACPSPSRCATVSVAC